MFILFCIWFQTQCNNSKFFIEIWFFFVCLLLPLTTLKKKFLAAVRKMVNSEISEIHYSLSFVCLFLFVILLRKSLKICVFSLVIKMEHSSIIWPVWLNDWVFVYELSGCGFESRCCHLNSHIVPVLCKEILDIQATIKCRFTLKWVCDMIIIYSQTHRTDKYTQLSSIILLVWLNGFLFAYELSGCWFESRCCHLGSLVKL